MSNSVRSDPATKTSSVSAALTEETSMFSVALTKTPSVFSALDGTSSVKATAQNTSRRAVVVATRETRSVSAVTKNGSLSVEMQTEAELCFALISLVPLPASLGSRTLRVLAIF